MIVSQIVHSLLTHSSRICGLIEVEKEPEIPPGRTPKKHRLEIVAGQREGLRTAGSAETLWANVKGVQQGF